MTDILMEASITGVSISRAVRDYNFSMKSKHFHDSYEIYYLVEGQRYYFIEQEIFYVSAGSLVLINREQIHRTSMADSATHERLLLLLDAPIFQSYLMHLGLPDPDVLFSTHYGVIKLNDNDASNVAALLMDILKEIQNKGERYELLVKLKIAELFIVICRYCAEEMIGHCVPSLKTEKHLKVQEVAEYLKAHYDTFDTLDELAAGFYISKSYLTRIFKEVTGFTIIEYLNMVRVKKAKHLLKNSNYSVTEIAILSGYESITYFERVFKNLTGLTPIKYKANKGIIS